MKRKIISMFLCSMILSGTVSGCSTDETTSDILQYSPTVEEIEHRIIQPPKEGWTIETIAPTIRLCGKSIELPFTVGSLGKDFEFKDNTGVVTYFDQEAFITAFEKMKVLMLLILKR